MSPKAQRALEKGEIAVATADAIATVKNPNVQDKMVDECKDKQLPARVALRLVEDLEAKERAHKRLERERKRQREQEKLLQQQKAKGLSAPPAPPPASDQKRYLQKACDKLRGFIEYMARLNLAKLDQKHLRILHDQVQAVERSVHNLAANIARRLK